MTVINRGHSVGPLWAKIFYTASGRTHSMGVSLRPSPASYPPVPGTDPTVMGYDLVPVLASVALTAFVTSTLGIMRSEASWVRYEIWMETSPGMQPFFVFGGAFTGKVGLVVNANPNTHAMQASMSFRTATGGKFRSVLFETAYDVDRNFGAAEVQANAGAGPWLSYLLSNASPIVGRDGSRPVSMVRLLTKTNDTWRRKLLTI